MPSSNTVRRTQPRACRNCGTTYQPTIKYQRICGQCKLSCTGCGASFTPKGREKLCGPCRFDSDPKVSQCAFCCDYYLSHDDSKAGVQERMHHFNAKCKKD